MVANFYLQHPNLPSLEYAYAHTYSKGDIHSYVTFSQLKNILHDFEIEKIINTLIFSFYMTSIFDVDKGKRSKREAKGYVMKWEECGVFESNVLEQLILIYACHNLISL